MSSDSKSRRKRNGGPILLPVDFSPHSKAALGWAVRMAELFKAPLTVLHVVHDPAEAPGYYHVDQKNHLRPMEEVAAEMLEKFLADLRAESSVNVSVETRLIVGLPVTRILEVADQIGAQMIIMGSQGRTGLAHLMLGSKAEQVVRMARIPVTIVKAPEGTK